MLTRGTFLTGWYTIYLPDCRPLTVLCDMDVDGGGWTVSKKAQGGAYEVSTQQPRSGEPKAEARDGKVTTKIKKIKKKWCITKETPSTDGPQSRILWSELSGQ